MVVPEGKKPYMVIQGIPLYFEDDWDTGIGGGLWSTGQALAHYFNTAHAVANLRRLLARRNGSLTVLELGSGNGFLAVCLAACASANDIPISELVITDFADHLDLMRSTVAANPFSFSFFLTYSSISFLTLSIIRVKDSPIFFLHASSSTTTSHPTSVPRTSLRAATNS